MPRKIILLSRIAVERTAARTRIVYPDLPAKQRDSTHVANWFDRRRREPYAMPILLLLRVTRRNASPRTLRQNSRPDGERIEFYEEKIFIIIRINIKKRYENDSNDYRFSFIFMFYTEQWFVFFLLIYPKILDYQVFETNDAFYYLFNVFGSGAPSYIWCCSVVDHARSI